MAAPAQEQGQQPMQQEAPQRQPAAPPAQQQGQQPMQQEAPQRQPAARQAPPQAAPDDDLPPWVTEFSDDSAVPATGQSDAPPQAYAQPNFSQQSHGQPDNGQPAQQPTFAPRPAPAPARAPHAYVITPVPELDWDGNWPALSARLPLRGVAQQLATQAELIACVPDGAHSAVFHVRVPIETWRTPPNVEKLATALTERFGRPVRVETELGPAWYTASAEAQAHREAVQRAAEETVANDPFIQSMIREFGAFVVPGSIVPPPAPPAH
eukprot:gene40971-50693_t